MLNVSHKSTSYFTETEVQDIITDLPFTLDGDSDACYILAYHQARDFHQDLGDSAAILIRLEQGSTAVQIASLKAKLRLRYVDVDLVMSEVGSERSTL